MVAAKVFQRSETMGGILLLEDGRGFAGEAFGARTTRVGEVVFNTAMTGYQEVLTDPSYREQIVTMTTPHIGNYGVNDEDNESSMVHVAGFVVRKLSRRPSNFRATGGLDTWLRNAGVPGLQGIDTRALVRHIRNKGAMKAVVSTDGTPMNVLKERLAAWPGMQGRALATEVSRSDVELTNAPESPRLRVTLVDGGAKRNIGRLLAQAGCAVREVPLGATAEEWMTDSDLIFFSNGPGDPAALPEVIEQIKGVVGKKPLAGICLGHQLLALALGAHTYKLAFGHRGANHPVRDELTGRVEITSQNHGFCVDRESLVQAGGEVTHTHLNDGTVAGFRHQGLKVSAVQFHPEASPGPHDSAHLVLERFLELAD
jgi:carbamoyl-phosphate synthase small subunit